MTAATPARAPAPRRTPAPARPRGAVAEPVARVRRGARQAGEPPAVRAGLALHAPPVLRLPRVPVTEPGDAVERQAETAAARIVAGQPVGPIQARAEEAAAARLVLSDEEIDDLPVARLAGSGQGGLTGLPAPKPGRALSATTRAAIEPHLGHSLADVRVHDDAAAHEAAQALSARAFTRGRDVWLGTGESDADVALMAHEAVHVVQQAGDVAPPLARRAAGTVTAGAATAGGRPQVTIPVVDIPAFKAEEVGRRSGIDERLTDGSLRLPGRPRASDQRRKWDSHVAAASDAKVAEALAPQRDVVAGGERQHVVQLGDADRFLVGSLRQLQLRARRPTWDREGRWATHDVDHVLELQLGGRDEVGNFWLLESRANQWSGSLIRQRLLEATTTALAAQGLTGMTAEQALGGAAEIGVRALRARSETFGDPSAVWHAAEVVAGAHLARWRVVPGDQLERLVAERGLLTGNASRLVLLLDRAGRFREVVEWGEGDERTLDLAVGPTRFPGAVLTYATGQGGTVRVHLDLGESVLSPIDATLPIERVGGVGWGGRISFAPLLWQVGRLPLKGLSPIEWTTVEMEPERGLQARGTILPTVPLIADAGVEIVIDGDDVRIEKVFDTSAVRLDGPIAITGADLVLRGSADGLELGGGLDLALGALASGRVDADAGYGPAGFTFGLAGRLTFDTELFDEAEVAAAYRDGQLTASGTLAIGAGRVRGVRSGRLTLAYEQGRLEASGQVDVEAPGVSSGRLSLVVDEVAGPVVTGQLDLAPDIPGLRGGMVTVQLRRGEDGAWQIAGGIVADLALPGASGRVEGAYDDGAFLVAATVRYARGRLAGELAVGATNRQLDADGQPTGPPGPAVVAFGRGSLTVALTPWLTGTAAVRIAPDGRLTIDGEIALPAALELFAERRRERRLLSVGFDVPLLGLAVAGQRVGVFLTVRGGVDAFAAVGPGQLTDLRLRVTYSPDDEDATRISGSAALIVPAGAGLRLFVSGAVGAGIPLVSALAGLEVGGSLAVAGRARVAVDLAWAPGAGFELAGVAELSATPALIADVTAFVLVELDAVLTRMTLYEQRWQLAAVTLGEGLAVGVRLPVRWREGEPFELSLDDVELTLPDVDPRALLAALVSRLTGTGGGARATG